MKDKQVKVIIGFSLQKEFTDGVYCSKDNKNLVPELIKHFNNQDNEKTFFIIVSDAHYDNYEHSLEYKYNTTKHCIKGATNTELISEIASCINDKSFKVILNKSSLAADLLPATMMQVITESRYRFDCDEPPVISEVEFVGFNFSKDILINIALLRSYYPNMNLVVNKSLCNDNDKDALENSIKILPNLLVDIR